MTVKELIEILEKQEPTHKVLLSSNPEGDMFYKLYDDCISIGNLDRDGDVVNDDDLEYWNKALGKQKVEPCIIIWP